MARNESRIAMELLARSCQKERYGELIAFQKFRMGSEHLCIRGYSRTGDSGNFGKTTDTFLIFSKEQYGPIEWFNPATDTVDFFVLLDSSVLPWRWTLLHYLGQGNFIETACSIECTIV